MTDPTPEKLVCARIARRLSQTVGSHRYGMWFDRSAKLTYSNEEDRLQVSVPNRFVADWIGRHFQDQLQQAAKTELGDKVNLCAIIIRCARCPVDLAQEVREIELKILG